MSRVIREAAGSFFDSLEMEQVLRRVAEEFKRLTGFRRCLVLLPNESRQELTVTFATPAIQDERALAPERIGLAVSDLPPGLFLNSQPVVLPTGDATRSLQRLISPAQGESEPGLLVPLVFDGRPLGLLLLSEPLERVRRPATRLLELLATHAAAAISNSESARKVNLQLFDTVATGKREWEQTFDAISDGIFISNVQHIIVRVNKAFAAIFDKVPRDIIGKKCYELVWNNDIPCADCPVSDMHHEPQVAPSSASRDCVIQGVTSLLTTYPMLDSEGELAAVVHVVKDVTEQKMMQELVIRAEKLRAVGEMASGIAHDFNNLLSSIIGWSEVMLLRDLSPELRESATAIHQAALDGTETVKRIQEYTRIRKDTEFGSVDINETVRGAVELARPRWKDWAEKAGIAFTITPQLAKIPPARGSASDLREVFLNIIFNAIDAMPEGGEIKIRTGRRGGSVFAAISDSGVGMPREVQSRIFDPFFTTKGPAGSGLGLSVAFGIVSRHGGKMTVDSAINKGSTFTVLLPLADESEQEVEAAVPAPSRKVRVLLIDDDQRVLNAIEAMLRSEGHAVTTCLGGRKALSALKDGLFDLVITDLGMPEVNGWEVAARAKAISPDLPVVLLSGWGAEIPTERLAELGLDGILQKPCRLAALRQVIHQVGIADQPGREKAKSTAPVNAPTESLHILVVEDSQWFGAALKERLEIEGHLVSLARSAREGLDVVGLDSFDLVLTDLKLPDGSGLDLAGRIVSLGSRPVIALMTGDINVSDWISSGSDRIDAVLLKPWKEPELQRVLKMAGDNRESRAP